MKTIRKTRSVIGIVAILALSGCFGGGDDDDPVPPVVPPVVATEVPDSAMASVSAFLSFVLGLSAGDETSEPLLIKDSFVAPVDDTAEPQPLV